MTNPFTKITKFIAAAAMFIGTAATIASCGPKGPGIIDYAHNGSVKLQLDYKNHDFFQDGIGQVTVLTYIDGDTTHFKNVYGDTSTTLKSRYYGIDTPESTGAVQPYGKKASNFTHEKLANAAEHGTIVVSSPFSTAEDGGRGVYGKPKTDSTGSRYLSLVWINETVKNAPSESLTLLNLWIVQEGLSWAKNTSDVPAYQETFSNAMNQAEKFSIGMWAGDDPDFNYGEYLTTSLLEMKQEITSSFIDPEHENKFDGAKVRFTGVVAGYTDRMLYVQEFYPTDEDNPELGGEWAGINIFCGMNPISEEYTRVGTYLEVVGNASDSDTFGFQVSGTQGHWPASLNGDENDCKILLTAAENDGVHALQTFEYSKSELNTKIATMNSKIESHAEDFDIENLYCRTKITDELVCSSAYLNQAGDELTLSFAGADFTAYIPFTYHGNPDDSGDSWMDPNKVIGKSFQLSGVFSYHKTTSGRLTWQLIACGDSDIVCLTPKKGTVRAEPFTVLEANEATFVPNVNYYLRGFVSKVSSVGEPKTVAQVLEIGAGLDNDETTSEIYTVTGLISAITSPWDTGYMNISFTIGSGSSESLTVYRTKVADGIDGSTIAANKGVVVQGNIKKYNNKIELVNGLVLRYNDKGVEVKNIEFIEDDVKLYATNIIVKDEYLNKVVPEAIVTIYGTPTRANGSVTFNGAQIMSAYPKGQTEEYPINADEAYEICSALEAGTTTSDTYYIEGIVKEITSPFDQSTSRISFVLKGRTNDFLVTGARFLSTLKPEDLVAGKFVVVRANFEKLADGTITTRQNGCQVRSITELQ